MRRKRGRRFLSTLSAIMLAKRRSEVKTERRNKYITNVQKRLKEAVNK